MYISWNEEYSVNVREIDKQHQTFIKILNDVYDAVINKKTKRGIIINLFKKLVAYAKIHFETEEKYFDKFHYKLASEHKNEHQKLKDDLGQFEERYQKNPQETFEITVELIDFLEDWLVKHLANQDQKYVKCFKDNGLY